MKSDASKERSRQRHRLVMFTLAALSAGACNSDPAGPIADSLPAAATVEGRLDQTFGIGPKRGKGRYNGKLAFSGFDGGIYTMDPDGFGITRLATGNDPSWSPDGSRIAFSRPAARPSSPYWVSDVYVMDADGSNVTLVARDGYQPTWSPDGSQLAYGCGGICVIRLDGTSRRTLTAHDVQPAVPEQCIRDSDPTWSPNGTTIAFTRWPDARIPVSMCLSLGVAQSFPFDFWTEVWFVESDGSGLRPLRGAGGAALTYAGWPAWSPDGSQLALYFASGPDEAIMVVNADGSGLRDVARRKADYHYFLGGPDWSPEGTHIVLGSGNYWGFVPASTPASDPGFAPPRQGFPSGGVWSWSRR